MAHRPGESPKWADWVVFLLGSVLSAAAAADQLYSCVVDGHTYTGGLPPAECRSVAIRVLNPDGSLHSVIAPPETAEQRRNREAEQVRAIQQQEALRNQQRRDRALLETYSSDDEIVAARDRALDSRRSVLARSQEQLSGYREDRKKLNDESEFYAGRAMPPQLKHSIEVNDDLQHKEQKIIEDMSAEMQRINERFDGELARFHELTASGRQAARH